jgi:hypothetical protein
VGVPDLLDVAVLLGVPERVPVCERVCVLVWEGVFVPVIEDVRVCEGVLDGV